jgi:transposase
LFYSYFNNVYSCRNIAQLLEENIYFMWLSGNSTPDFRTINNFRGKRLQGKIQKLFSDIVLLMSELGYVSLDKQFIDGTKIESAANKYTFVWKKSIEKHKVKLEEKITSVLTDIENSIQSDKKELKNQEIENKIDKELLKAKLQELNKQRAVLNKQQQKELKKVAEEHLPRLEKYEQQLETLGTRNSYSKTDTDATFMRLKEDHMKNGQLKPAYNIQISTENQIVTNFSIHQNPGDTSTLISHLEQFHSLYKKHSATTIADAGYGSEQNYEYLESIESEAYVKYNYFYKEQKRSFKKDIFRQDNLFYNADKDFFICPMGQQMHRFKTGKRVSDLGYESQITYYKAINCNGCPMRGQCHKGKDDRVIEVNFRLKELKQKVRERLLSEEGEILYKQRAIEPESVFGQIKSNRKYNRFRMYGMPKNEIDLGIVFIAHNLKKMAKLKGEKAPLSSKKAIPTDTPCIHSTNIENIASAKIIPINLKTEIPIAA